VSGNSTKRGCPNFKLAKPTLRRAFNLKPETLNLVLFRIGTAYPAKLCRTQVIVIIFLHISFANQLN
jgi:hypothetical protein